jgi:outer membrane protein assembly factor BamB
MKRITVPLLAAGFLLESGIAGDDSWPRFRGEAGRGIAKGGDVPVKLDAGTRAWSAALTGPGSSSPVVWGDKVFVTSEDRKGGKVDLLCHSLRDGQLLWKRQVTTGSYYTHKMNNMAGSTPALAEDLVVFTWYDSGRKMVVLSAYDHAGQDRWSHDVGEFKGSHGPNVVPEIHEGRVLIAHLHQKGGYVAALAVDTGKLVWRRAFPGPSIKTTYMTPLVRKRFSSEGPSHEVVVASTSTGLRGLSFDDGEELWSLPDVFPERCIVSPVDILAGGGEKDSLLAVGCKREGGNNVFLAARPPDVNEGKAEVVWHLPRHAPYVPTPVSDGKRLYVLSDRGHLQAINAETSELLWEEKLAGNFYASPLLVGGRFYCMSRNGEVYVAEVGEEFKLLATSELEPGDEVTWTDATPAVASESLVIRLGARLDCYRKK